MRSLLKILSHRSTQAVLMLATILLIAKSIWTMLPNCTVLPDFYSPYFLSAMVLGIVYRLVNACGWALVLSAMGYQVNPFKATKIWLISESRRWLPGGIWSYASRASQAEELGVSKTVAAKSLLMELLLTLLGTSIAILPALFIYRNRFRRYLALSDTYTVLVILALAILGTSIWLNRSLLMRRLASMTSQFESLRTAKYSPQRIMMAIVFYAAMAALNGLVTACLIWSTPMTTSPPLSVIIAATSFSWIVGLLAVFAPGGLVVRETCFAVCTGSWIAYPLAFAIAILARISQCVAELSCLTLALPWQGGRPAVEGSRLIKKQSS